ncbi:UvrABC system protein B [compost metagenome]
MGKVPVRVGSHIQAKRKIEGLRQELQQKIVEEEFEKAAKLRDQIRELEKDISSE